MTPEKGIEEAFILKESIRVLVAARKT